jgi:hypothetical protein
VEVEEEPAQAASWEVAVWNCPLAEPVLISLGLWVRGHGLQEDLEDMSAMRVELHEAKCCPRR